MNSGLVLSHQAGDARRATPQAGRCSSPWNPHPPRAEGDCHQPLTGEGPSNATEEPSTEPLPGNLVLAKSSPGVCWGPGCLRPSLLPSNCPSVAGPWSLQPPLGLLPCCQPLGIPCWCLQPRTPPGQLGPLLPNSVRPPHSTWEPPAAAHWNLARGCRKAVRSPPCLPFPGPYLCLAFGPAPETCSVVAQGEGRPCARPHAGWRWGP